MAAPSSIGILLVLLQRGLNYDYQKTRFRVFSLITIVYSELKAPQRALTRFHAKAEQRDSESQLSLTAM